MNYENETVTDKYVTYTNSVTYTLRRSYSSSATNSVYYNGYYYYWDTQSTSQEKKLGKQTVTTVYSYQYLPYGENEEILVKSTVYTHTAFDYDGGWLDFSREVKTNLSNLFESFDDLEKKCPDLAKLIDTSTTQKIFVDIVVPDVTTSQETYYSTYYYIEEK
jgi:hypothetical protein